MMLTDPPSTSHTPIVCGSTPGCLVTSSVKCTCGFCHFHSSMTPLYSTSLSISNIAKEWCAASDAEASANPMIARPIPLKRMLASREIAAGSSLDDLFGGNDRLFLHGIAGVAPFLERIADRRSPGANGWGALKVIAVDVRRLVDLRVVPGVRNREPLAVWREVEALDENRLRGP